MSAAVSAPSVTQGKPFFSVEPVAGVFEANDVRGSLGGFINWVNAGSQFTRQRYDASQACAILAAAAPGDTGEMARLLERWHNPAWAEQYRASHKANVSTSGVIEVSRHYPGLDTVSLKDMGPSVDRALESVGNADVKVSEEARARRALERERRKTLRAKTYDIMQFMCDPDVRNKFGITDTYMQLVTRHAVVNVVRAVEILQRYLREEGHDVRVIPGDYVKSVKAIKEKIRQAAYGLPAPIGLQLEVTGKQVFAREPGHESSVTAAWVISGPVEYTEIVVCFYDLCIARGPTDVNTLFLAEMVQLGITVLEQGPSVGGEVTPHVAAWGIGASEFARRGCAGIDMAIVEERVEALVDEGVICASAIRLDAVNAVANRHAYEELHEPMLLGVRASLDRYYASESVILSHMDNVRALSSSWLSRAPLVGEKAVLCYRGPNGLEVSDEVQVTRVEASAVVTTRPRQARPGCSGAALVAIDDGSLLGQYYGSSVSASVSYIIAGLTSSGSAASALSVPDASPLSVAGEAFDVYGDMRKRGLETALHDLSAAVQSVDVGGVHAGSAVAFGARVLTTLDPSVWPLSLDSLGCGEFVVNGRVASAQLINPSVVGTVERVRTAVVGEAVAVIARDKEGVVVSGVSTVRVVTPAGDVWVDRVSDSIVTFAGGLVFSLSDACALGMYAGEESTFMYGKQARVVPLSASAAGKYKLGEALQAVLAPALPVAWPLSALRELAAGEHAVGSPRVVVGAKVLEAISLQKNPGAVSTAGRAFSDDRWLGSIAETCGLGAVMRNSGDTGQVSVTQLACAMRAMFSLVCECDGWECAVRLYDKVEFSDYLLRYPTRNSPAVDPRPSSWSG